MTIERAAIIGATGPTGFHLAHELARRGAGVRVVSRSTANLERVFTGLEVSCREAEIAGAHLGRQLKVRAAPPWLLRIVSLFSPELRAFMPMVRFYARPISYNESALGGLIGPIEHTPYEASIPETLDWIAANRPSQA